MKLISTMDKAKRSVAPNMWPAITLVMRYSGSKTRRIAFAIAKKPQTARSQFPTFDDARPGTIAIRHSIASNMARSIESSLTLATPLRRSDATRIAVALLPGLRHDANVWL